MPILSAKTVQSAVKIRNINLILSSSLPAVAEMRDSARLSVMQSSTTRYEHTRRFGNGQGISRLIAHLGQAARPGVAQDCYQQARPTELLRRAQARRTWSSPR